MSAMNMNQSRSRLWVWITVIVSCIILVAIIIYFVSQPVAVRKMPATSGNPSVTDTAATRGK
ncbi:MAG: hypothetical protein ACM3UR_15375 [Bacteroidota bacterium]|nr:hypothetical protein [Ignavibacteria bacterium]MCU7500651.1 hypothetical protein [Ignavibacteria bacterium]MCU7512774.1 hypothetical protein [Ignavibacteria bacterium]MCU7520344.1 hypothetical protein [Ignavibacteria bacterium]MCU7523947.1 hypothetical protein [Ignavibacteria bacterium]